MTHDMIEIWRVVSYVERNDEGREKKAGENTTRKEMKMDIKIFIRRNI